MYKITLLSLSLLASLQLMSAPELPNIVNEPKLQSSSSYSLEQFSPQCPRGPRGPKGAQGPQGPRGLGGAVGAVGPVGATGVSGVATTNNFASLRTGRSINLSAGEILTFSYNDLDGDVIIFNGDLEYIPSVLITQTPGHYKITFGMSANVTFPTNPIINLYVDGQVVPGSSISSNISGQMITQSAIVYVNSIIGLQAATAISLFPNTEGDVTAFIEVVQLDSSPQGV